jgi:hypothetical protein
MPNEATPIPETLRQIAGRTGISRETVWRWVKYGVRVGGMKVKLRATRIGWQFTVEAGDWERFRSDCNPCQLPPTPAPETEAVRKKRFAESVANYRKLRGKE